MWYPRYYNFLQPILLILHMLVCYNQQMVLALFFPNEGRCPEFCRNIRARHLILIKNFNSPQNHHFPSHIYLWSIFNWSFSYTWHLEFLNQSLMLLTTLLGMGNSLVVLHLKNRLVQTKNLFENPVKSWWYHYNTGICLELHVVRHSHIFTGSNIGPKHCLEVFILKKLPTSEKFSRFFFFKSSVAENAFTQITTNVSVASLFVCEVIQRRDS